MARRPGYYIGPYKGLTPYIEADHPYFFGRERQRRTVAASLKSSPITTLYGPSGVGKSSLLAAGVVHDLMETAQSNQKERGRIGYLPVLFGRWRGECQSQLAAAIVDRALKLDYGARLDPASSLEEVCHAWIRADQGRLLLILDQFEEFFLYHPELKDQLAFGRVLDGLMEKGARVLLSLREDQLALLERLRPAMPGIFANQLRVDHLDEQSARKAIEDPIGKWNELYGDAYSIEKELTETLLAEFRPEQMKLRAAGVGIGIGSANPVPDALVQAPWLQIVMTRLWNEELSQGSSVLRLETLKRLQGVVRIAEQHLEVEMADLSLRERIAAANVFPLLVTPSGTKVLYPADDLIKSAWLFRSHAKSVLQKLSGEGRILEPIDTGGVRRYQIYHDQLGPAILGWRHRFVRRALAIMTIAFAAILLAAIPLYLEARAMIRQVAVAGSALTSLDRPDLSPNVRRALALYAWSGSENNDVLRDSAKYACMREFSSQRHFGFTKLWGVAFSPDGRFIALCGQGDNVFLMRRYVEVGEDNQYDINLLDDPGTCRAVAFASSYLATGCDDGAIRLYDPNDPGTAGPKYRSWSAGTLVRHLAATGKYLASSGSNRQIAIWEVASGRRIVTLKWNSVEVTKLVFNPRLPELASADQDGHVAVWKTTDWGYRKEILDAHVRISGLGYSPDGQFLAVGGSDGSVILLQHSDESSNPWSVVKREPPQPSTPVLALAFSGTPLRIALAFADEMRLMSVPQLTVVKSVPIKSAVDAIDVGSGGAPVATVHANVTYQLWNSNLSKILELRLTGIRPIGETGDRPRSVIPIGDLQRGVVGSWDAANGRWARLKILGGPVERVQLTGPLDSVVVPITSAGALPGITPPVAVDSKVSTDVDGRTVRLTNWNDVKAVMRASPPPPLTKQQCRDYLGATPCPPLPKF